MLVGGVRGGRQLRLSVDARVSVRSDDDHAPFPTCRRRSFRQLRPRDHRSRHFHDLRTVWVMQDEGGEERGKEEMEKEGDEDMEEVREEEGKWRRKGRKKGRRKGRR